MVCTHCGATLPVGTWHPATDVVEDGELKIYSFCDEQCRQTWSDERSDGQSASESSKAHSDRSSVQ